MRIDPSSADAQNSLGLALSQKGRGDEAVGGSRALVGGTADYVPARLNLGHAP